jgi:hypothetical protein
MSRNKKWRFSFGKVCDRKNGWYNIYFLPTIRFYRDRCFAFDFLYEISFDWLIWDFTIIRNGYKNDSADDETEK